MVFCIGMQGFRFHVDSMLFFLSPENEQMSSLNQWLDDPFP